jgi:hypothetical protein
MREFELKNSGIHGNESRRTYIIDYKKRKEKSK